MMSAIYARQDGTIAHLIDDTFLITPDAGTTLIVQFDADVYAEQRQHIANNMKAANWNGSAILVNGVVYLDNAWIQARRAETQTRQTDSSERANLLAQANTVLTQLETDRDNWSTLTTVALLRPVMFHMLIALIQVIKVLRAIVRNGLDDT